MTLSFDTIVISGETGCQTNRDGALHVFDWKIIVIATIVILVTRGVKRMIAFLFIPQICHTSCKSFRQLFQPPTPLPLSIATVSQIQGNVSDAFQQSASTPKCGRGPNSAPIPTCASEPFD